MRISISFKACFLRKPLRECLDQFVHPFRGVGVGVAARALSQPHLHGDLVLPGFPGVAEAQFFIQVFRPVVAVDIAQADPVVSPFFTEGLKGTPNEVKIKYLADNDYSQLSGEALRDAIKESIRKKDSNLVGQMVSEGTTPRQLTDLIGSLCDLTSGSGDKGTPVVLVQGYFDNYTND